MGPGSMKGVTTPRLSQQQAEQPHEYRSSRLEYRYLTFVLSQTHRIIFLSYPITALTELWGEFDLA